MRIILWAKIYANHASLKILPVPLYIPGISKSVYLQICDLAMCSINQIQ